MTNCGRFNSQFSTELASTQHPTIDSVFSHACFPPGQTGKERAPNIVEIDGIEGAYQLRTTRLEAG
jgi:hypothetical protein